MEGSRADAAAARREDDDDIVCMYTTDSGKGKVKSAFLPFEDEMLNGKRWEYVDGAQWMLGWMDAL